MGIRLDGGISRSNGPSQFASWNSQTQCGQGARPKRKGGVACRPNATPMAVHSRPVLAKTRLPSIPFAQSRGGRAPIRHELGGAVGHSRGTDNIQVERLPRRHGKGDPSPGGRELRARCGGPRGREGPYRQCKRKASNAVSRTKRTVGPSLRWPPWEMPSRAQSWAASDGLSGRR